MTHGIIVPIFSRINLVRSSKKEETHKNANDFPILIIFDMQKKYFEEGLLDF